MNADPARDLILKTYDTVADDTLWPEVLQQFAHQLNAVGCIIFEWRGDAVNRQLCAPILSSFYDRQAVDTYIDKCNPFEAADQDVFERHSLRHDGIDLIEDDVLGPSLDALKNKPNVQILRKMGIFHRAAGLLNKDNRSVSRFSVQYGVDRGRTTDEEHVLMAQVLPHIAKALDLGRPAQQLAAAHQGLLAAMDRLVIGACVLDASGAVVARNEEFRRQLESYETLSETRGGLLEFARLEDQKRFEMLRTDALHHGQFGARPRKEAIGTDAGGFLCIEVTPLNRSDEIGSDVFGGCILYSIDTSRPVSCSIEPIRQAFGLTETEASLVEAIGKGLTNAQIAEQRNRSVATVNVQVKSILSKARCATRTLFVRLMMNFGMQYLSD